MPTNRQIEQAYEVARKLCPGVRIKGIGPDGVIFEYPDASIAIDDWENRPFSGDPQ
jgi:hypothetical protein